MMHSIFPFFLAFFLCLEVSAGERVTIQDALERLSARVKVLGEELAILREKVVNQEEAYARLEGMYSKEQKRDESAEFCSAMQRRLDELEKRFQGQQKEVANLRSALKMLLQSLDEDGVKEEYTVKAGDTLEKIASRFHTTIGAIKKTNRLKNDRIYVGQKLRLPKD